MPTVRLVGVPVDLFIANNEHIDALLREFQLIKLGQEEGESVGPRLSRLIEDTLSAYTDARQASWQQAERARSQGWDRVDIDVALPADAAPAGAYLLELLADADEFCRREKLLTLAATPEMVALRRWANEEVVAQLEHGAAPTPCPL